MEFPEQYGRIAVGRDGVNTVEGLYCVVCGAASELERSLGDAGMPKPDGLVREVLTNGLFQPWLMPAQIESSKRGIRQQKLRSKWRRYELVASAGQFPDEDVILVAHLSESERHDLGEIAQHAGAPLMYRLTQLIDRLPDGKSISIFRVSLRLKPFLIDMFERDCLRLYPRMSHIELAGSE